MNFFANGGEREVSTLRDRLEKTENETKEVIDAASNLNKQLQTAIEEKERLRSEFEKERREMTRHIESIEAENKRLLA